MYEQGCVYGYNRGGGIKYEGCVYVCYSGGGV